MATRSQIIELPLAILVEQLIHMLLPVDEGDMRDFVRKREICQRRLAASRPY